jgi:uncharacterized protein (UPF0333 family)
VSPDPTRDRGFIALEWVAAVAMLLLPAVVLVGTLPTWAERRHAATVAAREAARELQLQWPAGNAAEAELVARYVAGDHGIAGSDVSVRVIATGTNPGDQIQVEVRVRMPAIALPGLARVGAWNYAAVASLRVDDYRSR